MCGLLIFCKYLFLNVVYFLPKLLLTVKLRCIILCKQRNNA